MYRAAFLPLTPLHRATLTSCLSRRPRLQSRVLRTMTTMEERFDVLKEDGTAAGYSKARSAVHRDGDWHRTTHIWVLGADGRILMQKRSALKDTYPGCWDVSAAGHITAGDQSRMSAVRELGEELGIMLEDEGELEFVTSERMSARGSTEKYGEFVDNEIQDIYVYRPDKAVEVDELKLQEEEVEKVEYWKWDEYKARLLAGDMALVPRSEGYFERFFPWLERKVKAS
eukprot:GFKZ01008095.1.p1 GENE.GFKZ01008095.1~~GFKZ01008095.1.p1  ORF type:complete len:257 (+),score=32.35 GFKZ01008095.1:89-772(+)